jgi:hypothetical protein
MEDYNKLLKMYQNMKTIKIPERIENIQLRTPLEVEDIYRTKIKELLKSLKYKVENE